MSMTHLWSVRHKQQFCAKSQQIWQSTKLHRQRFFFHCKFFRALNILMRKSGGAWKRQYIQYMFSIYVAKDRFSLASPSLLRRTQGVSLNSSTWPVESAPLWSQLKFQEEFRFYSLGYLIFKISLCLPQKLTIPQR